MKQAPSSLRQTTLTTYFFTRQLQNLINTEFHRLYMNVGTVSAARTRSEFKSFRDKMVEVFVKHSRRAECAITAAHDCMERGLAAVTVVEERMEEMAKINFHLETKLEAEKARNDRLIQRQKEEQELTEYLFKANRSLILRERAGVAKTPAIKKTCNPNEQLTCVLCIENTACMALIPCGHICYCDGCVRNGVQLKCPICRSKATETLRVYPGGVPRDDDESHETDAEPIAKRAKRAKRAKHAQ